jgi:hypothetical protein
MTWTERSDDVWSVFRLGRSLCGDRLLLAHGSAAERDDVSVVDQAVADRVRDCASPIAWCQLFVGSCDVITVEDWS